MLGVEFRVSSCLRSFWLGFENSLVGVLVDDIDVFRVNVKVLRNKDLFVFFLGRENLVV